MLREACLMHVAPEHFWPWPFRAEVVPLLVVTSTVAWVTHAVLRMCPLVPSASLMMCWRHRASAQMAQPEAGWDQHW
jgi:hypothetical protein